MPGLASTAAPPCLWLCPRTTREHALHVDSPPPAPPADLLEPVKKKFPWISYSDLWTLGGAVAIEAMGGEQLPSPPLLSHARRRWYSACARRHCHFHWLHLLLLA